MVPQLDFSHQSVGLAAGWSGVAVIVETFISLLLTIIFSQHAIRGSITDSKTEHGYPAKPASVSDLPVSLTPKQHHVAVKAMSGISGLYVTVNRSWGSASATPVKREDPPLVLPQSVVTRAITTTIPEIIVDRYTDDYDITYLDQVVLRKLEEEKTKLIPALNIKIAIEERKKEMRQTIISRRQTLQTIATLEVEKTEIVDGLRTRRYVEETKALLERYRELATAPRRLVFGETPSSPKDDKNMAVRHTVINDYLIIAAKYITLNIVRVQSVSLSCDRCKTVDSADDGVDGVKYCAGCGVERASFLATVYEDRHSDSKPPKMLYDNKNNVIKAMKRYQCRQAIKTDLVVLGRKLEDYFVSIQYPSTAIVQSWPLNEFGKRGDTSVTMIFRALKKIKMTGEYKNANFIGVMIWKWVAPDISHLEERILADYDTTQRVFIMLEGPRKASISTQFRLFKHLEICEFPCKAEDFKLPETEDSINYHETTWRIMCERCGDPRIKYKPTSWTRRG